MKVITFGELMLRFAPEGFKRFVQSDKFCVTFGGAEANVSVALSNWGIDSAFVSKMPAHEIGQLAVHLVYFKVWDSNFAFGRISR